MDFLVFLLYRFVSVLLSTLPLGLVFVLGQGAGFLAWLVFWPYRRLAHNNLRIAFEGEKSEAQIRGLVRRHFMQLGGNALSGLKLACMSGEAILERVSFENLELLTKASQEQALVFVLSHMGNWELLAQVVPRRSEKKLGTIFQRLGNRFIDADVRRIRMRTGMATFERQAGFQGALQLLREKGGVGVLVDQHAGDKGVWCPFFGRLASTSPLAATMAIRTGANLLSGAVYTVGRAKWRIVFTRIPRMDDVYAATAEINRILENQIRRSPEDWFWVHNRWKTPEPKFLVGGYKRGLAYPSGFEPKECKPFRIVIRASNWLGDAVMSAPAVTAIKRGRPDAHVTVLTPAKLADFWRVVPEVDEVIGFEKKSLLGVVGKIRGRFDAAVVFPNSVRVALEVFLAGIPRRVGYAGRWRRLLLNQLMPSHRKAQPKRHQVHHYLELAASIGADINSASDLPRRTAPEGPLKIGVCPGAEYGPAKRWPAESFAEVAKGVLARHPSEWLLFGVAKDGPFGEIIAKELGEACENLIGKTSLAELIGNLRQCRLLLTNDTGTMHLAAFLGVPTVSIFGSTEPSLTGPLGSGHVVLRYHVECSPCFLRECPLDFRCMTSVTVSEVARAVEGLLR